MTTRATASAAAVVLSTTPALAPTRATSSALAVVLRPVEIRRFLEIKPPVAVPNPKWQMPILD